jgi:hypothetical protein
MSGRKLGIILVVILALLISLGAAAQKRDVNLGNPERKIITGVPPFGTTQWTDDDGKVVPAGCGPEAARMLLAYYDRRYGYKQLVRGNPGKAIVELHERMNTTTVKWHGDWMGFTDPLQFKSGLKSYIEERYPGGVDIDTKTGTLSKVFEKSVELIDDNKPHIILFDWEAETWIFPNHYAVVVGYSREQGRQQLIINTGWGYDFQILDMTDTGVAPATLYWIEKINDQPDGDQGCAIGPGSAQGMWVTDQNGKYQLAPILHKHFDPNNTVSWAASDRTEFFIPNSSSKIGACYWY